jgi:hypothetical protein
VNHFVEVVLQMGLTVHHFFEVLDLFILAAKAD